MLPAHLLVHEVTVVHPAPVTDAYQNTTYDYGPAASRRSLWAWLQQDQRAERNDDGRGASSEAWLLMCNDPDIAQHDRVDWAGHPAGAVTFVVDGPPEPTYTPRGFHHLEATLAIVKG